MNDLGRRLSFSGLLRAARVIMRQRVPSRLKRALMASYFRLCFLRAGRRGEGRVRVSGFNVKYCSYDSLLYLFREIFLEQVYWFHSESDAPSIIDCGANIGMSVLYFKMLYPAAEILAFEPDPDAFASLSWNTGEGNGFSGVSVRNEALAGNAGRVSLYSSLSGPGDLSASFIESRAGGPARTVNAVRLSDFIDRPVQLLKMDIEGAETEVLKELKDSGKLALVSRLLLEYHHHIDRNADSFSGILALLESCGFGYQLSASLERPLRGGRFQDILVHAYKVR